MATYIPAYKGYIADVPRVWFRRCDKRIFYFDEITQANVSPQTNYTEVNAGWSQYPVAYLPGQGTLEATMTSGQFNAELFALANGADFAADANYTTFTTEHPAYDGTANTLTLQHTPVAGSVSIAGVWPVKDENAVCPFSQSTNTISFTSALEGVTDGDQVEVSYEYQVTGAHVIQIDNKTSAIGEAVFKWPVYNAGEDCTEASIKGYVVMHLYRCRVTAMPKHNWAA